ncbi:hypothetical protein LguiA_020048 [Lonicera macranthoides]
MCRNWFVIIQNPRFVTRHLHQYQYQYQYHPGNNCVLVHSVRHLDIETYNSAFKLFSSSSSSAVGGGLGEGEVIIDNPLTMSQPKDAVFHHVLGPVNGLYLLHYGPSWTMDKVALWNPATRAFRPLPSPNFNLGTILPLAQKVQLGFGLDLLTNDCNVVMDSESQVDLLSPADWGEDNFA